jgi:hypothetical protein
MRRKKGKYGNVLRLGRADTKKWEDDGPTGHAFRTKMRNLAKDIVKSTGKSVEIYASESAGGWMADQITPERDDY